MLIELNFGMWLSSGMDNGLWEIRVATWKTLPTFIGENCHKVPKENYLKVACYISSQYKFIRIRSIHVSSLFFSIVCFSFLIIYFFSNFSLPFFLLDFQTFPYWHTHCSTLDASSYSLSLMV